MKQTLTIEITIDEENHNIKIDKKVRGVTNLQVLGLLELVKKSIFEDMRVKRLRN